MEIKRNGSRSSAKVKARRALIESGAGSARRCSNWNLSQLCTQTIHYLGDCSTVNSESDTYANECG